MILTRKPLPRDASLEDDHRAVEYVDGIPMVPKLERKDLKDADLVRHGDGAIAGALMQFAALNHAAGVKIEFQSTGRRSFASAGDFTADGFGGVGGGNDFEGYL